MENFANTKKQQQINCGNRETPYKTSVAMTRAEVDWFKSHKVTIITATPVA
jgi:hypothetical protein